MEYGLLSAEEWEERIYEEERKERRQRMKAEEIIRIGIAAGYLFILFSVILLFF